MWNDVEPYLIREADADLAEGDDIRPCMVAFRDDEPLFVAFLRSFAKGEYDGPVIELLALAAPLQANRVALSIGARAWSFEDPVPPVVQGVGDLRQRVLYITTAVEGAAGVGMSSALVPFQRTGKDIRWEPAVRDDGGQGWICGALRLAVEHRGQMVVPPREIRRQARRCVRLGHLLALDEQVAAGLGLRGAALR